MTKILILLGVLLSNSFCISWNSFEFKSTTVPSDSRYEIITLYGGKPYIVFKLDKFNGDVWARNKSQWKKMERLYSDVIEGSEARFQLAIVGLEIANCILLDTKSGKTWYLESDEKFEELKSKIGWVPFNYKKLNK